MILESRLFSDYYHHLMNNKAVADAKAKEAAKTTQTSTTTSTQTTQPAQLAIRVDPDAKVSKEPVHLTMNTITYTGSSISFITLS